jgi:putative transposase
VLGRQGEVWQVGFTDHRVRDEIDFEIHRSYAENNPVRRGLSTEKGQYRFGSAYPGFRLDRWTSAAEAVIC